VDDGLSLPTSCKSSIVCPAAAAGTVTATRSGAYQRRR
jgi:hypothetical protein